MKSDADSDWAASIRWPAQSSADSPLSHVPGGDSAPSTLDTAARAAKALADLLGRAQAAGRDELHLNHRERRLARHYRRQLDAALDNESG